MALRMRKPPVAPKPNVLLYGMPKTGKTTAAAGAPGKKLLLNGDTVNSSRRAHEIAGDSLDEAEIEGLQTLIDVGHLIKTPNAGGYDTIIMDPISDVYRLLVEDLSKRALRPSLPLYGDAGVHLERFCRALCEAPVNVVLVAHVRPFDRETADGKVSMDVPFTGSSTNPTLGLKIASMVDVIGFTGILRPEDGEPIYAAQLIEQQGRLGGDRFNVIAPDGWAPLDLADWFGRINAASAKPATNTGAKPEKEQ